MRPGGGSGGPGGGASAALRASLRSHGSSTSTSASDPREKVKDCCRKLVAFMCTQVGVGGLVVGYAIVGAVGFIWVEDTEDNPLLERKLRVQQFRATAAAELWTLVSAVNTFDRDAWTVKADEVLLLFQKNVTNYVKMGYDGLSPNEIWTFPAALMFCLSIFTMIGYGNMVPRTPWGKGLTVVYAVFGIPLYVLYFMNMGEVLATTFRWLYARMYECSREPHTVPAGERDVVPMGVLVPPPPPMPPPRIIVPSTAGLWVIVGYVLTGTIMFAEWEGWNYLDSTYFCVTSLCKIGIGDFVPGANISEYRTGNQTKLVINFVYLLLGMGLVAMCYNLMRAEVRERVRELREDVGQCLEDVRARAVACAGRDTAARDADASVAA